MENTTRTPLSGPTIRRGQSRQDYETPFDFLGALWMRFGPAKWDLAATRANAKAPHCFTPEENSLVQDWHKLDGLLFLNPPFDRIEPWAHKCRVESEKGAKILFLTPASIGSVWFANHVHRRAMVLALNPRLSFDAIAPYPKDLILSVFMSGMHGFDCWTWKRPRLPNVTTQLTL